jgi:hypothetical protein
VEGFEIEIEFLCSRCAPSVERGGGEEERQCDQTFLEKSAHNNSFYPKKFLVKICEFKDKK